jgi:hypothetical protein
MSACAKASADQLPFPIRRSFSEDGRATQVSMRNHRKLNLGREFSRRDLVETTWVARIRGP